MRDEHLSSIASGLVEVDWLGTRQASPGAMSTSAGCLGGLYERSRSSRTAVRRAIPGRDRGSTSVATSGLVRLVVGHAQEATSMAGYERSAVTQRGGDWLTASTTAVIN